MLFFPHDFLSYLFISDSLCKYTQVHTGRENTWMIQQYGGSDAFSVARTRVVCVQRDDIIPMALMIGQPPPAWLRRLACRCAADRFLTRSPVFDDRICFTDSVNRRAGPRKARPNRAERRSTQDRITSAI